MRETPEEINEKEIRKEFRSLLPEVFGGTVVVHSLQLVYSKSAYDRADNRGRTIDDRVLAIVQRPTIFTAIRASQDDQTVVSAELQEVSIEVSLFTIIGDYTHVKPQSRRQSSQSRPERTTCFHIVGNNHGSRPLIRINTGGGCLYLNMTRLPSIDQRDIDGAVHSGVCQRE